MMTAPHRRTVLIVDDAEDVISTLRRSLAREPWTVRCVATTAEANALLETGSVDVVIADDVVLDRTGLGLLAQVGRCFPDTMRILVTGHADLGAALAAVDQGDIYRFLRKPCDDIEVRGVVRAAFERLDRARENERLLRTVRTEIHAAIERAHPELHPVRDATGSILLDDSEGEACMLAAVAH